MLYGFYRKSILHICTAEKKNHVVCCFSVWLGFFVVFFFTHVFFFFRGRVGLLGFLLFVHFKDKSFFNGLFQGQTLETESAKAFAGTGVGLHDPCGSNS